MKIHRHYNKGKTRCQFGTNRLQTELRFGIDDAALSAAFAELQLLPLVGGNVVAMPLTSGGMYS